METAPGADPVLRAHQLELDKLRVDHLYEVARNRAVLLGELARLGLRSLLLLNGGAIVALFTVLGHVGELAIRSDRLKEAFGSFAAGVVLAMLSLALGFVGSNFFAQSELAYADHTQFAGTGRHDLASNQWKRTKLQGRLGAPLWYLAVGLAVLSIGSFVTGSWLALEAVQLGPAGVCKPAPGIQRGRAPI